MSEPLTMSAEREAECWEFRGTNRANGIVSDLCEELRAQRAAHKLCENAREEAYGQLLDTREQLRHSREVSTALLEAAKTLLSFRSHQHGCEIDRTDFCNCGLMQAAADARAAIAQRAGFQRRKGERNSAH